MTVDRTSKVVVPGVTGLQESLSNLPAFYWLLVFRHLEGIAASQRACAQETGNVWARGWLEEIERICQRAEDRALKESTLHGS